MIKSISEVFSKTHSCDIKVTKEIFKLAQGDSHIAYDIWVDPSNNDIKIILTNLGQDALNMSWDQDCKLIDFSLTGTKTEAAIKNSITHWVDNENGPPYKIYSCDCPLCHLFVIPRNTCRGCPVAEMSGFQACEGTPWKEVAAELGPVSPERKQTDMRDLCKIERQFLESVLLNYYGITQHTATRAVE